MLFYIYLDGVTKNWKRVIEGKLRWRLVELSPLKVNQFLFVDFSAFVVNAEESLYKLPFEFGTVYEIMKQKVNLSRSKVMDW